ncbi:MAG: aminofutalosine synthase MqnE, partial [Planctomycetes bacterium]|nr:aminofutalosine synthase MqnE [Planctomycetota bacterium]
TPDLLTVGRLASLCRERHNGRTTWYIVNRHINYSNVCENRCKFCAFHRTPSADGAYTMTLDEVVEEACKSRAAGATELHIVGGLHPDLPLGYYIEMLSRLHEMLPAVHLQAFTAVEIAHLADTAGLTERETLMMLKRAGLGSLPGGGAEVFAPRVREALCPRKIPAERWLEVMATAHDLGIPSNATMLYGHIERPEELVDHMLRLRDLQDRTGGFMTFIPLAFHPQNTELAASADLRRRGTTAYDDLRALAVGRLMLDNVPHVKAFWIMLGLHLAQLSQHFGVDDIDGTVVQEKITHAAGAATPQALTVDEIRTMIVEAGYEPQERNTVYRRVIREGSQWRLE